MHAKRLADVAGKQRAEAELEIERLRHNQMQAERALEARERAHRQRVKVLEDQVCYRDIKCVLFYYQSACGLVNGNKRHGNSFSPNIPEFLFAQYQCTPR